MKIVTVSFNTKDGVKATNMLRKEDEDNSDLMDRAVVKIFGKNCFWWGSNGNLFLGQVFRRLTKNNSNQANTSVTYLISASIKEK